MGKSGLTEEQIRAKYGIDNRPGPDNPIVAAICGVQQIMEKSFNWSVGIDLTPLFDRLRCTEMYTVADRAMRDLRAAMARGEIAYLGKTADYDPAQDDAAMFVNFVGTPQICVVEDGVGVELFAAMYQSWWRTKAESSPAKQCVVRIAPKCGLGDHLGTRVEFWPLQRGQFLLMFMICPACKNRAIATAEDTYRTNMVLAGIEAGEDWTPACPYAAPREFRSSDGPGTP